MEKQMRVTVVVTKKANEERKKLRLSHSHLWERGLLEVTRDRERGKP